MPKFSASKAPAVRVDPINLKVSFPVFDFNFKDFVDDLTGCVGGGDGGDFDGVREGVSVRLEFMKKELRIRIEKAPRPS